MRVIVGQEICRRVFLAGYVSTLRSSNNLRIGRSNIIVWELILLTFNFRKAITLPLIALQSPESDPLLSAASSSPSQLPPIPFPDNAVHLSDSSVKTVLNSHIEAKYSLRAVINETALVDIVNCCDPQLREDEFADKKHLICPRVNLSHEEDSPRAWIVMMPLVPHGVRLTTTRQGNYHSLLGFICVGCG